MHLKMLISGLALSLCVEAASIAATPVPPDTKTAIITETWSVPGILGGGIKANDSYTDGSFFLTLPALSSIGREGWLAGDVIFIEPYTSWGEQGEVAVSLGLGWRHLFSQQGIAAVLHHDGHQAGLLEEGGFIGANLFVDMLDTQFDNRFWQLGFGIEAGTRYIEARANYYLPLSDRQLAEEIRTRESVTTQAVVPTYHEPFATGHTIQQDVTLSTLSTTTTIERLFRRYEDGMEGWDAELALLLPWIDRWMDVKLIGGYYAFDNQPFGPQAGGTGDLEGWKAGVEVRPVPAVVLNATWYEDEQLTGSDWIAGVRLELPFEAGDLGDGQGFWGRIGDAFRPRRRHLAERMVEPVKRQNAAVKVANTVEEDKSERKFVTRVVSQTTNRIVLADDVIFVNNGGSIGNGIQAGSASGDGTAEKPVVTIQSGANLGQSNSSLTGRVWNVYTQASSSPYQEDVTVDIGSVNFISSGRRLLGLGGKAFGGGTAPTLLGGFGASTVPFLGISGYTIVNGQTGIGIGVFDVPSVSIVGNTILNTNPAIYVINFSSHGNALIAQNTVAFADVRVDAVGSFTLNLTASGNVITDGGIVLNSGDTAHLIADVSRNTVAGIAVLGFGNSTSDIAIRSNTISGSSSFGVYFRDNFGAPVTISAFDGNVITGFQAAGIQAEDLENPTSTINGTINNIVTGPGMILNVDQPLNFQIILNGVTVSPLVDVP